MSSGSPDWLTPIVPVIVTVPEGLPPVVNVSDTPVAQIWGWCSDPEGWVKILANSEGKLIIDPSEILQNDPQDGQIAKAPTSNWAYDHKSNLNAHGSKYSEYRCLDKDTSHSVLESVGGDFRIPISCSILSVGAYVDIAGVTGLSTIDILNSGVSIFSTKITIDSNEKTSKTAETSPVISAPNIDADSILTFNIDVIQTTPAKGLVIWLEIQW